MEDKKKMSIGHNQPKEETDYATLFENMISMFLEPKPTVDIALKEALEKVRVSTRVADRFSNLQDAENIRKSMESRLNTLEHFELCRKQNKRPYLYMWDRLQSEWSHSMYEFYLPLKDCEYELGTSWKTNPTEEDKIASAGGISDEV
jgi:hypothetical protein|tara:strand:- start:43 stop:483 length:441 start_codon:yes stop_codon:yes gene_type:complete